MVEQFVKLTKTSSDMLPSFFSISRHVYLAVIFMAVFLNYALGRVEGLKLNVEVLLLFTHKVNRQI